MSYGEESPLAKNKNYYLYKSPKKRHPLIQLFSNISSNNSIVKEEPKNSSLFTLFSRNALMNYTRNKDDNMTIKSNTLSTSAVPDNIGERNQKKFMTNSKIEEFVSSSPDKKINNEKSEIKKNKEQSRFNSISTFPLNRTSSLKIKPIIKIDDTNNLHISKFKKPINKFIKHDKVFSFQNYDNNNTIFISQPQPVKVKNFPSFGPDKGVYQKTISLNILNQPNNNNNQKPKKKISNDDYPYIMEKTRNIKHLSRKESRKKRRYSFFPSLNIFNINTEKLNLNERTRKNTDLKNDELSEKLSINFSSANNSTNNYNIFSNYKTNINNSACKLTLMNDITKMNKNEFKNNFIRNSCSIGDKENTVDRNTIKSAKKRKSSIILEDDESFKLKRKLQKKYSVERTVCKKNFFVSRKKTSFVGRISDAENLKENRKKAAMSLKNNIQYFNKLTGNKKLNNENKNKDKITLFHNISNKFFIKDPQIKKEEKNNDKNSYNSKSSSCSSFSIERKGSFKLAKSDEKLYIFKKLNKNKKSNYKSCAKFDKIINLNNIGNESEDQKSLKLDNNEEEEKNENDENSIREFLKEKSIKRKKLMKEKGWNPKHDDENIYYKKNLLKMKSKLNKTNNESYVYNTCKKEIKNNFLQNTVIENLTNKIIETFGLKFLDEEKSDKIIEDKLLLYDENKKKNEELENRANNKYLFSIIKSFKELYTKEIKIKYNFSLFRIEEKLSIYDAYLLKMVDNSWNEINDEYDYRMEMINYISQYKVNINYTPKTPEKLSTKYYLANKEKKDFNIKTKKYTDKILKADKNFFKDLEQIQRELYFKTSYLSLKINILDFEETDNIIDLNITSDKSKKWENKKRIEYFDGKTFSPKGPKKSSITTSKLSKSIRNSGKKCRSVIYPGSKKNVNLTKGTIKESYKDLNNKLGCSSPSNRLFRKSQFMNYKNISNKVLMTEDKIQKGYKRGNEYENDVEEKERKLKNTESNIVGLNILKNKFIFAKDYLEKKVDLEKRISEICKLRQKRKDLDKKMKTDSIIIKTSGYDSLSKEATLIKTQEMENDLPDFKLLDKFVKIIQERKYNLFEKYTKLEGSKFLKIINKQDLSSGNTLLYFASQNKLLNFMKLLLIKGANPNIQNKFGNTPLHVAYKFNSSLMINLLVQYNANKQIKNIDGLLPWQMSKYVKE